MPVTPTTQNPRGYGDVRQNDVNMPNVINAIKNEISRDVEALSENTDNAGGGVPQGDVLIIEVPANSDAWIKTGIILNGEDALWLEVSGMVSHQAAPAPTYGPYHSGGMYLVWTLVTDGSTPVGDVAGQNDFRLRSTAYRKTGELHLRARDLGSGDNQGKYIVKAHYFADPGQALAPLGEIGTLRDALTALTIRVSALDGK